MDKKLVLPDSQETVAVALSPKTAALCFDRVWASSDYLVPRRFRCYGGTSMEDPREGLPAAYNIFHRESPRLARCTTQDEFQTVVEDLVQNLKKSEYDRHNIVPFYLRIIAGRLRSHNINAVTAYGSTTELTQAYYEGPQKAAFLTLQGIPVVDEEALTWDQVEAFRNKRRVRNKYRRFLNWLAESYKISESKQADIEKQVRDMLEEYRAGMKEAGLKTIMGTILVVLEGADVFKAIAQRDIATALSGITKAAIRAATVCMDLRRNEHSKNGVVAWVHEASRLKLPGTPHLFRF